MFGRWFAVALAGFILVHASDVAAVADDGTACSLRAGQKWSVKSGDGANVVIGRVEDWHAEKVVHVSITDIPAPAGSTNAGTAIGISHVPFSCSALRGSVDQLISEKNAPAPGFEGGYQAWREAKGGIFTIGVNEVITLILKQLPGN